MKDMNFNGLDHVKADKKLIDNTVDKVLSGTKNHSYFNAKISLTAAASLMIIMGGIAFYSSHTGVNSNNQFAANTITDNSANITKPVINNNTAAIETLPNKNAANDSVPSSTPAETPSNTSGKASAVPSTIPKKDAPAPSNNTATNANTSKGNIQADNTSTNNDAAKNNVGIAIPQINLDPSSAAHGKMLALVVYNGKIYTQSATEVDAKSINTIMGEKIGRTINSIDEWNVKEKSSEELASNIGEQDIYTVRGYDSGFRIMSYSKIEGQEYVQLFDCLNGITVKSGNDIFGKLNLVNNIESAKFIGFDDWNTGIDNYVDYKDINLLNEAVIGLNNAVPFKYEDIENDIESFRNNDGFRQVALKLKDGSQLRFTLFKNGYASYGYTNIYFKVDSSVMDKLWQK